MGTDQTAERARRVAAWLRPDDERLQRDKGYQPRQARLMLGAGGFVVASAEDGLQALRFLQHSAAIDLVLIDRRMPEMNGIDMLQALRSSGQSVPFCFVTSEGSPEMVTKAEAAGAMFVITKPFTPESFRDKLEAVLGA